MDNLRYNKMKILRKIKMKRHRKNKMVIFRMNKMYNMILINYLNKKHKIQMT